MHDIGCVREADVHSPDLDFTGVPSLGGLVRSVNRVTIRFDGHLLGSAEFNRAETQPEVGRARLPPVPRGQASSRGSNSGRTRLNGVSPCRQ